MATLKIFNSFSEPTRWGKEDRCESITLPKGTNQVERNPTFYLLLKLHAFCFNYSNLTRNNNPEIFLVPKRSLLPPRNLAVFHTLEATSDKLRAVFWNWSSTGQIGQSFTDEEKKKKKVVFVYSESGNKNTLQATVQTVKRDWVTQPLFVLFPHTDSVADETQERPH